MPTLLLSFDTEDFVTPESDDALLMLATELSKRGLRGNFALVGDKLRGLIARQRQDVIEALRAHEIHYHSNDHHFFPLQAPRLDGQPWEESLAWLLEHEAPGVELIQQTFGTRPLAYVKADSHWTPQLLTAYRAFGVEVYSARHFEHGSPALWWYMNLLAVPYLGMLDTFIAQPGAARDLVTGARAEIMGKLGAGDAPVVTYGTHPCLWCCEKFYDLHNVKRRGSPPPREKWQPAPLLPPERIRRNRQFFPLLLDALLAEGDEFTTYGDLAASQRQPQEWLTPAQLGTLARQVIASFGAATLRGRTYHCAEILAALCHAVARLDGAAPPRRLPVLRPLGPVETPRAMTEPLPVCGRALQGAAAKMDRHILQTGRLASGIDVGGHHFAPAQLLQATAEAWLRVLDGQKPACAPLLPGPDCPREAALLENARIGAWSLPAAYEPAGLLEIGRLQSWTLKPASR